jgi:hypothetical protein
MAYGYSKTFYTLGNVITKATFLGFAERVKTTMCTHKGCGYKGPNKVKCKMERWTTLTHEEVHRPDQEIEYALLEITLAGRSGSSCFIVNLKNKRFLPKELRVDWNRKTAKYAMRHTDKRSWSRMDINNVENKEAIIDKIWDTFQ